jgi:hypothetical protein
MNKRIFDFSDEQLYGDEKEVMIHFGESPLVKYYNLLEQIC